MFMQICLWNEWRFSSIIFFSVTYCGQNFLQSIEIQRYCDIIVIVGKISLQNRIAGYLYRSPRGAEKLRALEH